MAIEGTIKSAFTGSGGPSREFVWIHSPTQIVKGAKILFSSLSSSHVIDEWIYLIRQARHPDFLWKINYIIPTEELSEINKMISESELILFEDPCDIILKKPFTADPASMSLFNVVRAYTKAENGQISEALNLWDKLYEDGISTLSPMRQTNLLMHFYVSFLCSKQFEKAFSCYTRYLALTKLTTLKAQHSIGLLDNLSIMYCLHAFFLRHVPEFLSFMSSKLDVYERELMIHKKSSMLDVMPIQFFVQTCSKPFYDYAKTLMPLPDYDIQDFKHSRTMSAKKSNSIYEEKYADVCLSPYSTKTEICSRKWDLILHLQQNNNESIDDSLTLLNFLGDNNIQYNSVVDAGCGLSSAPLEHFKNKDLTRFDISTYAGAFWKNSDPIIESSAEDFFDTQKQIFDICFCSNALSAFISPLQFLEKCSSKCKYLVASIPHSCCGLYPSTSSVLPMWENISSDDWIAKISKYFDIQYLSNLKIANESIYVIGKSKQP